MKDEEKTGPQTPDAKKKEKDVNAKLPGLAGKKQSFAIDLPLAQILVRKKFNHRDANVKIQELAASIAVEGLRSPIHVWEDGGKYYILDGHRRHLALTSLQWPHLVRCEVIPVSGFGDAKLDSLASNVDKEAVSTYDLARAFTHLDQDEGITRQQIALRTGTSDKHIGTYVRCYTKLHPKIIAIWSNPNSLSPIPMGTLILWSQAPHEKQLQKLEDYLSVEDDGEDMPGDGAGSGGGSKGGDEDEDSEAAAAPGKRAIKAKLADFKELQENDPNDRRGAMIRTLRWILGEVRTLR